MSEKGAFSRSRASDHWDDAWIRRVRLLVWYCVHRWICSAVSIQRRRLINWSKLTGRGSEDQMWETKLLAAIPLHINVHGYQLGNTLRVLNRFDGVFRRQFSHDQCSLAVGCHLDGRIDPLHEGRSETTAAYFHDKSDIRQNVSYSLGTKKLTGAGTSFQSSDVAADSWPSTLSTEMMRLR